MNITFLLGNGFDIGLKLKTGYKCFYEKYCVVTGKESENILDFKEMLSTHQKDEKKRVSDWSDFEKAFGEHSKDFSIEEKKKYIERFEDFVSSFNSYIESEEKKASFSQTQKIADIMLRGVTTYFHVREQDRILIQNLYNSIPGRRIYNFISFNYTRSVDQCAYILKNAVRFDNNREVGKVLHIHGYIDENMIMGVNDPSQIKNPDFAKDEEVIREIVKPIQNAMIRANYEGQVINCISTSDIICVYGMSIGETDKKWWEIISKWLAESQRHVLVILKHDSSYNKRFPFSHQRAYDEVYHRFLTLSGQTEEIQKRIKSQIYVGMNNDVFEMDIRKIPQSINGFN